MRVLILGNNRHTAEYVEEALRQVWCETEICMEAEQGDYALKQGDYDAVILGEALEGMDWSSFMERARRSGCQLPVLMLFSSESGGGRDRQAEGQVTERPASERPSPDRQMTEKRMPQPDPVQMRIRALECGADYCLNMPVDEGELLAVLKAIGRRRGSLLPERLSAGDLYLDQSTFTLSGPAGTIQLGRREFDVMRLLMVNRDIVVSKEMMLNRIWGGRPDAVDNNVEVYISFLRKKLKMLKVHASIVTMRRLGYKLTAD